MRQMGKTHNKKRNVGIIFEQLIKYVSAALINENKKDAQKALEIIRIHLKPGSELYKEFRLFNALIKTRVDRESIANRILEDAKGASKRFDRTELRKQKSALIKEINHRLNDPAFYSQRVDDYRSYATIQTLLNDWRSSDSADLTRVANYENEVLSWLLSGHKDDQLSPIKHLDDINSLSVKIMTEKFNKKYGNTLNDEQQLLIREYVFSLEKDDGFHDKLLRIKKNTMEELKIFIKTNNNQVLSEKLDLVYSKISDLDLSVLNDISISKFLTLSKLKEELMENDNG